MKINTKNAKNGVTSTVNLAFQKFSIKDTKERSQIRVTEVKKVTYGETFEGIHILFFKI